ncbi:class I SAM-dependent methyltransferase [Leisingera caerulea]|uniref:class I SAM-dependent methyltransferase n=1 Tax=Leisingera caerulea TaxID=506591 RepID=UPI0021A87C8B|nr:class I SAM-dependent methyltransferase [Leisingera caerulea]UWQ49911.1 class I SAM-dependent methyltransferase [Leisingera caerulea]
MASSQDLVRTYYDRNFNSEENRLHGRQLEYDMMIARLDEQLPANASVLEIGAGTGHYSEVLLRRGHHVTAVDISGALVAKCAARLRATGLTNWRALEADATTLVGVAGGYDACLIMGPMYQLAAEADRTAALRVAAKRLKPKGLLFTTWLSRFGILGQLLAASNQWANDDTSVGKLLCEGLIEEAVDWYCTRIEDVAPFHENVGFETVRLWPLDPGIMGVDDGYNSLRGDLRHKWFAILMRLAEEPTMLGCSRHLLYVGRSKR